METDVLWGIFNLSQPSAWKPLCLLDLRVWTAPELAKWAKVANTLTWHIFELIRRGYTEDQIILWYQAQPKTQWMVDELYRYGDPNILRKILTKDNKCYIYVAFCKAAKHGNLEMLKWLANEFNLVKGNFDAYDSPSRQLTEGRYIGRLKDNDFHDENYNANSIELSAFHEAVWQNNFSTLDWLVEHFQITKEDIRATESPSIKKLVEYQGLWFRGWLEKRSLCPY